MDNPQIGRSDAGGAAGQAGANYQARIAAWLAVRMLAGSAASPLYGLAADVRLTLVRCQTESPVDDVVVSTSENGFLFVQAKNRIATLSVAQDSEFGKVIAQFVQQFLSMRQRVEGVEWRRPLDPEKDRLVLTIGSRSTSTLTETLGPLLQRFRELSGGYNLDAAARNKQERDVAAKLMDHARRAWKNEAGTAPTDSDITPVLRAMRVHVVDVGEDERDARDACDLLRGHVLRDSNQAEAVWSALIDITSQRHETRSGFTAASMAEELRRRSRGFAILSPPDFRTAIEALQSTSRIHIDEASRFSQLLQGEPETTINRDAAGTLLQAVRNGHLLVVGEPGAGKTGLLYQLACQLSDEGASVVFLSVQYLTVSTTGDLSKALGLGVEQDLTDLLSNWFETESGYVIFDALDAARSEPTRLLLQRKIGEIIRLRSRWTVVASVREYDLRYGEIWRNLFHGTPPTAFSSEEFPGTRHIYLPRLSGAELARAVAAVPALTSVLTDPPPKLRDLLQNIFNLHLMAILIREQEDQSELRTICYQIDLLHHYWRLRVHADGMHRDARERAITAVLRCMIARRLMNPERLDILENERGADLSDLEQTGILRSPASRRAFEGDVLVFAHHILFDYATARLTFRLGRRPNELVEQLEREPDLALMLGPSLSLCFEGAWLEEPPARPGFWKLAFALSSSEHVPELAKLVAPTTVAANATLLEDLVPLLKRLDAGEQATGTFLWHMVIALLVRIDDGHPIVGENAGPWAAFADSLSERIGQRSIYSLRTLVWKLTENPQDSTAEQLIYAGRAARRLLDSAWKRTPRDRNLVITGLEAVCDTSTSDPGASGILVRQALELDHLRRFGYEELSHIAHKARKFIESDPELAIELYRAAFGYDEPSTEAVPMGGVLLGLTSNRRQDYRHCWWELAEAFPGFLASKPVAATRALIAVLEGYVARERQRASNEWAVRTFPFKGQEARYREDWSYIWAPGPMNSDAHDDALRIFSSFYNFLRTVSGLAEGRELFASIVETAIAKNELAVLWAVLLHTAADAPEPFARELIDLAVAPVVLTMADTRYAVARYIERAYPTLDEASRTQIERAILGLPEDSEYSKENRLLLVGYLQKDKIVTKEAIELRMQAEAADAVSRSRPLFRVETFSGELPGVNERLSEKGIDVKQPANRALIELIERVRTLNFEQPESQPAYEKFVQTRPLMEALWEGILAAGEDVDRKVIEEAIDYLADRAANAARFRDFGGEPRSPEFSLFDSIQSCPWPSAGIQ